MNNEIFVRLGRKALINNPEHYIVTIDYFVCLRILGDRSNYNYKLMTATADEDDKRFRAVDNQKLLIEVARKTSEALGHAPSMCHDNYGRNYMGICRVVDGEDLRGVIEVFDGFFREAFNGHPPAEAQNELRELYDALAPDESGEDVYLSDGMWLSSGGAVKDLGR
jgi:hypothetical protein